MTYRTQYGQVKDGKLLPGGLPTLKARALSEIDNVERAGYRTLSMQIKELEDAGKALLQTLRQKYPAPPVLPPETPE